MHAIRTTPGFIIDARPYGEAGKMLSIFTRDLGLVVAVAQGIRLEKSKLRYHARELSFGNFSLVRGKEVWRLTSVAEPGGRQGEIKGEIAQLAERAERASESRSGQELIARIAMLLRRLLHGEEAHPELFDVVAKCAEFLADNGTAGGDLNAERSKSLESLIVLRILHALGYVGADSGMTSSLGDNQITVGLLDDIVSKRAFINQHINKALHESHL